MAELVALDFSSVDVITGLLVLATCGIVKSDFITLDDNTGLKFSKFQEAGNAWNIFYNLLKVFNLQAKLSIFQEIGEIVNF